MPIDVSVIIVNWNTRDLLRDCLNSLRERAGDVSREVIVVDNASCDRSADMVAAECPEVRLVANDDNRGFAAANNQGIALAGGRYVLLLNSDTRILDRGIEKVVRFADEHPQAAVVGARTLNADGTLQWNCYQFPSLLNLALSLSRLFVLFPRNRFFGRARMTWWDYDTVREVDAVAGCFMLVRRTAIDDVGPMPEEYFMYSEDTDWCWQFHRKGYKTMYTPETVVMHLREASSSQCVEDMHVLQRRSLLTFLEKKSGKTTRRLANVMFTLASAGRLLSLGMIRLGSKQLSDSSNRQWRLSTAALRFHLFGQTG
jgi:GT2 family glycosyltransferase